MIIINVNDINRNNVIDVEYEDLSDKIDETTISTENESIKVDNIENEENS